MIVFGKLFLEETTEIEQWPDTYLPVLFTCSLKAHCSYSLKFFVVKNHLRNRSLSNCGLRGSSFARSRPSQRSKYTEGVARRIRRCIAVQRLSRKYVQKKVRPKRLRDVTRSIYLRIKSLLRVYYVRNARV